MLKQKVAKFLFHLHVKFIKHFLDTINIEEGVLYVPENLIKTFQALTHTSFDNLDSNLDKANLLNRESPYYSESYYHDIASQLLGFSSEEDVVSDPIPITSKKERVPSLKTKKKKRSNRIKRMFDSTLTLQEGEAILWQKRPSRWTLDWLYFFFTIRFMKSLNYLKGDKYTLTNKRVFFQTGIFTLFVKSWENEWIIDVDFVRQNLWQQACNVVSVLVTFNDPATKVNETLLLQNVNKTAFSLLKKAREDARTEKGVTDLHLKSI